MLKEAIQLYNPKTTQAGKWLGSKIGHKKSKLLISYLKKGI
jgi:hypothetical protein